MKSQRVNDDEAIDALVDTRAVSDALTEARRRHKARPFDYNCAIEIQALTKELAGATARSRNNIRRVK